MRNLFALIGILIVGVGGTGWYLGWYKVNVSKNQDGKLQIQTDVDTKKVSSDSTAFFQKVGQIVNDKVQQTGQNGTQPPSTSPAATPGSNNPGNAENTGIVPTLNNLLPNNSPALPNQQIPPVPPVAPPSSPQFPRQ